jgi:hypothetical protein
MTMKLAMKPAMKPVKATPVPWRDPVQQAQETS